MIDQLEIVRKKLAQFGLDVMAATVEKSKSRILELESERDELKRQIEAEAIVCGSYRDERDELKAKLADMEIQKPVQWVCELSCNPWPIGGGTRFDTKEQAENFIISEHNFSRYDTVLPIYRAQPKPPAPAQRITEQDLRNIIKSYMEICIPFKVSFESWMSAEGEVLLAKLNENREPELAVWYGPMPETNGKENYTAILYRKDKDCFLSGIGDGITIDRSEYPDRVRYEADRMRYMIGELKEEPFILDYDSEKHTGYVKPVTSNKAEVQEWQPIENAPKDQPNLQIFAFADYTDEPKGVDVITVEQLRVLKQYTWWMPFNLPLPPQTSEWCGCGECQSIKNDWENLPPSPLKDGE